MSKHHQQNKAHQTNRLGGSISVGPETQDQEQMEASRSHSGTGVVPVYEDIQRKAYQLHEEKGGSDLENWLEAERLLKEENKVRR